MLKKFTLKNQGGLRNTWWILNKRTSRKLNSSFVKEIKLNEGNSIHDPYKLSNAFNNHFSDISLRLANEIHVNENGPSHVDYLCEIYDCIFKLNLAFIIINYPKQSNRFGQHIFKSYRIALILSNCQSSVCNLQSVHHFWCLPDEWKLSKLSLCLHVLWKWQTL